MTLLPYELSFINPINIFGRSSHKLESKEGLIIKIEKDNITSCADVSPLQYLNFETFETVYEQSTKINTKQIFSDIDLYLKYNKESFLIERFLDFDFSKYTCCPSLQHGLSCLFSQYYRTKFNIEITGKTLFHGLIKNQFVGSTEDEIIKKAILLEKAGFVKAKIKIGTLEINDEILKEENQILRKILSQTQNLSLRLDANQKFCLSDFLILLKDIDLARIDYVEEPVAKTSELLHFTEQTRLNIALDENVYPLKDVVFDKVSAVVLKPTLIGDYHALKKIITHYAKRNISAVFSSSFESQVGIYQIAQLAYMLNPQETHGLDTFDCYLENLMDLNITKNAITLEKGIELKGPLYI